MTVVKICGITELEHGLAAIDAGATYLGFVFYPPSSRLVDPLGAADLIAALRQARPAGWHAVGVFVNEPLELVELIRRVCALDIVQLNGEEEQSYVQGIGGPVFKSVRYGTVREAGTLRATTGADRVLLDANVAGQYGGTGVAFDWSGIQEVVGDGFLAGGLTPENVAAAIQAARPWGVDVSSGVEREGAKDPDLIRAFIAAVRAADAVGSDREPLAVAP
jgi:phosphoribosylanthranilate isomerase